MSCKGQMSSGTEAGALPGAHHPFLKRSLGETHKGIPHPSPSPRQSPGAGATEEPPLVKQCSGATSELLSQKAALGGCPCRPPRPSG